MLGINRTLSPTMGPSIPSSARAILLFIFLILSSTAMGSANSKETSRPSSSPPVDNKLLLDRLRALELENKRRMNDAILRAEKGYIFVEQEDGMCL